MNIFTGLEVGQSLFISMFYVIIAYAGIKLRSPLIFVFWGISLILTIISFVARIGIDIVMLSMVFTVLSVIFVSIAVSVYET